jgi:hypothetical protein
MTVQIMLEVSLNVPLRSSVSLIKFFFIVKSIEDYSPQASDCQDI